MIDHPLQATYDGKGVIDPYDIALEVFTGKWDVMRQSTLGSFSICPNRVKYSRDNPHVYGGSDSTVIGTGYHAGLEAVIYADIIGDTRPEPDVVGDVIAHTIDQEIEKVGGPALLSWATGKFNDVDDLKAKAFELYKFRLGHPMYPDWFEPVEVELGFRLPWGRSVGLENWAATGTIDLVLWSEKKQEYRIVDHKTAGRMWQQTKHIKSPQPHWYSQAIQQGLITLGIEHGPVQMDFEIMTYAGKFERRSVTPTLHTIEVWNQKAAIAAQTCEADGPWFQNTDSNLCSPVYCDAWNECPSGASFKLALGG